jgi:hypothetical protein
LPEGDGRSLEKVGTEQPIVLVEQPLQRRGQIGPFTLDVGEEGGPRAGLQLERTVQQRTENLPQLLVQMCTPYMLNRRPSAKAATSCGAERVLQQNAGLGPVPLHRAVGHAT